MNTKNTSTSGISNSGISDIVKTELSSSSLADRQMSPARIDNAVQVADGDTEHVPFGRRRQKRAVSLRHSSEPNERQRFHKTRVGEAKLSQRFPPHVDEYDHLNQWDDWTQDEQQQHQQHRELASGGASALGRIRSSKTTDGDARRDRQATWPEGNDLMRQRTVREFDSIGGGLVIPDMRRRQFDSFAAETPAKKRQQSYRGSVIESPDRRREFDSIDGGLIVPDKRREFDSPAGEISSIRRRQPFAPSRGIAVDPLAPAATVGHSSSNVDLSQLTAVRRNAFDSLGGGLIPVKRRAGHAFFTDVDNVSDQVLQQGPPDTVDGWNEIETESDAAVQAAAKRDFDSLGGGLVLPI
jgi:hypothetical protein